MYRRYNTFLYTGLLYMVSKFEEKNVKYRIIFLFKKIPIIFIHIHFLSQLDGGLMILCFMITISLTETNTNIKKILY